MKNNIMNAVRRAFLIITSLQVLALLSFFIGIQHEELTTALSIAFSHLTYRWILWKYDYSSEFGKFLYAANCMSLDLLYLLFLSAGTGPSVTYMLILFKDLFMLSSRHYRSGGELVSAINKVADNLLLLVLMIVTSFHRLGIFPTTAIPVFLFIFSGMNLAYLVYRIMAVDFFDFKK